MRPTAQASDGLLALAALSMMVDWENVGVDDCDQDVPFQCAMSPVLAWGPPTPQALVSLCAATAVKKLPGGGGDGTTVQPPAASAGPEQSSARAAAAAPAPNKPNLGIFELLSGKQNLTA
jgi:hypothetical protein